MKRGLKSILIIGILTVVASGATYSAFTAEGKVLGNQFSTGHADLALLKDPGQPPTEENLTTSLDGFIFDNITDNWQRQVGIKVANTGDLTLQTLLAAQTAEAVVNPDLKDVVKVKVFRWFDNGDGLVQNEELGSETETKTLTSWISTPFTLGIIPSQGLGSYVIQFQVETLDNSYQGKTSMIDFVFDATVAL